MEREKLINEATYYCKNLKIVDKSADIDKVRMGIEWQIDKAEFIESLINEFVKGEKRHGVLDRKRFRAMLSELDTIRWDMEYPD